jgi:lysylphosphatidylglycerol synthetase-like protein (DUF2156 family)
MLFLILAMSCFLVVGQIWRIGFGKQNLDWLFAKFPGLNITVISMEILIISVIFGILGLVLGLVWGTAKIDTILGCFLFVSNLVSIMWWFSWELGKSEFVSTGIFVTIVMVTNLATAASFVPKNINSLVD